MLRRPLAMLALPLAALALGACGTTKIDNEKAASEMEKGLKRQLGLKQVSVTCPKDIEAKKGDKFDCQVRAGKAKAKIVATQRDDKGNIRWQLSR